MNYIKSPFNYIGGKHKLLPQILPHFPKKISMFYDVFGGGFSVGLNVDSDFVHYNDIVSYVGDVFYELKGKDTDEALREIKEIISKYQLSKTNEEGFNNLRSDYNKGFKTWASFYVLTCFSFNYQYRFNNSHEYNSSFGKNRSCFSDATEQKFISFMNKFNTVDVSIGCDDFRNIDFSDADENDLAYFDPPYLISIGNYNDGKRGFKGWSVDDEKDLYELCDKLDNQGTRFAVSNVTHHKGEVNDILLDWSAKYHTYKLNINYSNSNYQKNGKEQHMTREVLITNYN